MPLLYHFDFVTGRVKQERGNEMSFVWQVNCAHPDIRPGKSYVIIGKDGNDVG